MLLMLVVILTGSAGCTINEINSRPTDWADPVSMLRSGCLGLSGSYKNEGVSSSSDATMWLFDELTRDNYCHRHSCMDSRVDISWPSESSETVKVSLVRFPTGFGETKPIIKVKELTKSDGDFYCENGTLIVDYNALYFGYYFVDGATCSGPLRFESTVDGSIIRKAKLDCYGYTLIVPYAGSVETYAKWNAFELDYSNPNDLPLDLQILHIIGNYRRGVMGGEIDVSSEAVALAFEESLFAAKDAFNDDNLTTACKAFDDSRGYLKRKDADDWQIKGRGASVVLEQIEKWQKKADCIVIMDKYR